MKSEDTRLKILETVLAAARFPHRVLTEYMDGVEPVSGVDIAADTNCWGYWLLDVTLGEDGALRLIEANGSNGGATYLADRDEARVKHMAEVFEDRKPATPSVILISYSPDSLLFGEVHHRADALAAAVGGLVHGPGDALGSKAVSVVVGSIPELAENIECTEGRLFYRERRIGLLVNPNILAELCRQGKIHRASVGSYEIDTTPCIEGGTVGLVHDKLAQQVIAAEAGFAAIEHRGAIFPEEAAAAIRDLTNAGRAAVLKPSAASGGCGVRVIPPYASEWVIYDEIAGLQDAALKKYGPEWSASCLPLGIFEFVRSSSFHRPSGGHLWDLRYQVLVRPGSVVVMPVAARLCPSPFDGQSYEASSTISNVTGRNATDRRIFRGDDPALQSEVGLTDAILTRFREACVAFAVAAERRADSQRERD